MNDKEVKMIKISLPDGSHREYENAVTVYQVAQDISKRLADAAICAEVEGKLVDMNHVIDHDAAMMLHTFESDIGKEVYWHSTAHLMAQAVKQLFPKVQVTIGPAIEQGFYYDFDKETPFTEDDLVQIEERMKELSKAGLQYERKELSKAEAVQIFADMKEDYKLEILAEIPDDETISTYQQGDLSTSAAGRISWTPARSKPSSCSKPPALTGVETRRTRCSDASMASASPQIKS